MPAKGATSKMRPTSITAFAVSSHAIGESGSFPLKPYISNSPENSVNQIAFKKLSTARSQLILNKGHGFWGSLALRLKLVEDESLPTLAVDGRHIFYNPGFVIELSDSLVRSALAHEVMHCVFDHMKRRGDRKPRKWNQAGDYVINLVLQDAGFEIGSNWLLSPAFRDMTADEIYAQLPDNDDPSEDPMDNVIDGAGDETTSIEWQIATIQAATAAKTSGNLPASLQRFVEQAVEAKVDWRDQLRQFITQISRNDYAWSRPNRRFLSAGVFLPGLYSESMGPIVIGVDTSGSIGNDTLQAFASEIRAIVAAVSPEKVHVVYCDAAVAHVDEYEPFDEMVFAAHGGGGTAFKPVFDYVEEKQLQPACLVYLTDLYGDHRFAPPGYPVMWASTTDQIATFGQTIKLEL
jgi:predicted metal-dependent peptidase